MSNIATLLKDDIKPQCRFYKLLGLLDTEDYHAVTDSLRAGTTPNKIAKAIRSGGHKISHSTIQEHKEKRCICKGEFQWV